MKKHRNRFGAKLFSHKRSPSTKAIFRRFSLGGVEGLELRAMLTASSSLQNAWQDMADASIQDVHSTVPTMRSMLASCDRSGSSAQNVGSSSNTTTSSPPIQASTFSALASDGGASTDTSPVAPPVADPLVLTHLAKFRLEVEDTTGAHNPITSVQAGQDVVLAAFVQDTRTPASANPGVAAAFMNVAYDSGLATIASNPSADPVQTADQNIIFGSFFATNSIRTGSLGTAGQIQGAGATSFSFTSAGTAEQLLWRITVHTTATGNLTFTPSFDSTLDHDSSSLDPLQTYTADDIDFVPASVQVTSLPTVSITPTVSANEGNTGTSPATPFVFTVSLSDASTSTVTVGFATTLGTAQANDIVAQSGTVTFAAGETSKLVTIGVVGDTTIESDETFSVTLSSPSGATLGANSVGVGTIVNDDTPSIGIAPVSQLEGNETNNLVFTVTISQAAATDVVVPFHTVDGTAVSTGGSADFTATSGSLTFAAGVTTPQLVTVQILGDTTNEDNESFHLVLTQPANAVFDSSNGDALATLLNDDGPHITFNQLNVSHPEGDSGTTAYVFTVNIGVATDIPVTVQFATQNGADPAHSATAGSDYTATSGTLTFAPGGDLTQNVTVLVNGDTTNEADENFVLNLSGATNATIANTSATGVIQNDDPLPTLSFQSSTPSLTEGDSGTSPLVFTVNLSAASGQTVSVQFATHDGTATTADNDYTGLTTSTLTFAPGETQKLITVLVNGDTKNEVDETFTLDLFNSVNAGNAQTVGTKLTATGTILNNDAVPTLTLAGDSHNEGNASSTGFFFTATLSAASGQVITVPFSTADDTATAADNDYTPTSGTLTFQPGETLARITVFAPGDTKFEADETFKVNLSPGTNVNLDNNSAVGTIVNDDAQPTVGVVGPGPKNEGDSGTTDFVFTVSLSNASGTQVTVNFTTSDGTATVTNNDYVGQNGVLTFAPGDTTKLVTVAVNGDTRNEGDETFNLVLSAPSGATLSSSQTTAQGLILNDDPLPTISIADFSHAEGDSGTTPFVFPVTLSAASGQTVTVAFATANGTATTANNDYIATSGTLTFAPGVTTQNITVQVVGDLFVESNETFLVNLSSPTLATIADNQATGTIVNEETDNITFTPSTFSGFVFVDVDGGNDKDASEKTLGGISVTLTGTSSISGNAVNQQANTANDGSYSFANLDPGTYQVTFTQPVGYLPAKALVGAGSATALSNGSLGFSITIPSLGGVTASNNDLAVPGLLASGISQRMFLASAHGAAASASTLASPLAAPAASALSATSDQSVRPDLASALGSTAQFTQDGSVVTVHGTSGDDHFEFVAGSNNVVTINGITRSFDPASVSKIVFDGGGGKDTASLTGSSGDDVADLSVRSGSLSGVGFSVSVNNVSSLNVNGGGGHDTATLHDTALSDHLQAAGDGVSLANDFDDITSLLAFERVQAISTTGADTARVGSLDFTLEQQGNWIAV